MRLPTIAAFLAAALVPGALSAQSPPAPPPPADTGGPRLSVTLRSRVESWDWFDDSGAGEYTFVGNLLRVALHQPGRSFEWRVEAAAPVLLGLPGDAAAPPPQGQLGLGAAYAAANDGDRNPAGVFLKQAWVRFGAKHRVRLGRFEFLDGTETTPRGPTLAAVKRERAAARLIGNFGFTHAQRSLDGAHYTHTAGPTNVTLLAARPTRGVFGVDGWGELDVGVAYGALTRALAAGRGGAEGRVFAIWYRDYRDGVVATDNRPLAARQADEGDVSVFTAGAHAIGVFPTGAGEVDVLVWGAAQRGEWESLDHRAGAVAVEAGWQPPVGALRPWLRAGYFAGSGDGRADDGRHGTFFQVLPTPRPFARFPFHNLMNVRDAFASLALRPDPRVSLRADVHALRLSSGADLWYSGGGAFEDESFGFAGRPGGGSSDLATLVDVGADVRVAPFLTLSAYAGFARGGDVVESIYPGGGNGRFVYLEAEWRPLPR